MISLDLIKNVSFVRERALEKAVMLLEKQAKKVATAQKNPEEKVDLAPENLAEKAVSVLESPAITEEQETTRETRRERKRPYETCIKRKRGSI